MNWRKYCFAATFFIPVAGAHGDVLNAGVSARHTWDDNFARSPEKVAEEITITTADIGFTKKIQNQNFRGYWQVGDYEYAERSDLDAVIHQGELRWYGTWAGRIKTDLQWTQGAHVVDRLEFADKDIVIRDDAKAKIGYGSGERLAFYLGGRTTEQTHWNKLRSDLDYDEDEVFIEADYKTAQESLFTVRLKRGDRTYSNRTSEYLVDDLDFVYQQLELETVWVTSPKTSVSAFIAAFIRDGLVNNGSGSLADIALSWTPTEKLSFKTGVEYKQPAVGEISDSPTDVSSVFIAADWQLTGKIKLASNVRYTHQKYDNASPGFERTENFYSCAPLIVIYEPVTNIKISLETAWRDNQSPLLYRDYEASEATLGLAWRY